MSFAPVKFKFKFVFDCVLLKKIKKLVRRENLRSKRKKACAIFRERIPCVTLP